VLQSMGLQKVRHDLVTEQQSLGKEGGKTSKSTGLLSRDAPVKKAVFFTLFETC